MTTRPTPAPFLPGPDDPAVRTLLLRGGRVHSPADRFATAVLVQDGTVAWVGSEGAADSYARDADAVVDLGGALVTPAFVDAHVHATATGLALTGLDLTGCPGLAEALARIAAFVRAQPAGGVVVGHGWDETGWPERRAPTLAELDAACAGAAVYLSRTDVHSALASSALRALADRTLAEEGAGGGAGLAALAGYHPEQPLSREAHHAVRSAALAHLSAGQRDAAQRAALGRAAELGIGAVHECAGPGISSAEDLTALLSLAAEGRGPEVFGYWGELGAVDTARRLGAVGAGGDLFVDGAIGSHTACLHAPYSDAAGEGAEYVSAAQIADHVAACTEAGLQAGFHAIGDAALASVVQGVRAVADKLGLDRVRALRHRVEHAEMLDADAVAAFADLGLTASVQPAFDAAWGGPEGMYAARLGAERARAMNPFAALLRAGVPLAFGSDAPVTALDPWGTVRAAAFHRTPEHRISVRAAFTAHTRGGWRALGRDDAGVLLPGAPASYAVWSSGELLVQAPDQRVANWSTDPRAGVPGLPDLSPGAPLPQCLATVVRGRTVHRAEHSAAQG
ncbi:amidohydrolase family protein [Streptacidiphilus sp. PB12-B1b]|uniref:amidohydrolase n=1 Tax=Streptacidiphilus sp. PB12-B1b TaxID=2705012 RepID=UPI0015FA2322|nr:amidohydrolase family protein [Streptacidiphilus sp. PB12-B1b]QMU76119.1 amidohydrolase family protein [Streptacidiphilus sp. PB12-B1b]